MLIGYVPEALVYHHIPPERMTVEYFRRRAANQGVCDLYSEFHRSLPRVLSIFKRSALLALTHGRSWLVGCLVKDRADTDALNVQLEAARSHAQLEYMLKVALDKKFRSFVVKKDWLDDVRPAEQSSVTTSRGAAMEEN